MTLQIKPLKQNISPEFKELLSTDKSVLIHPVLWAHSPDASRTQYLSHRYTYPLVEHYPFLMNTGDPPSLYFYYLLASICTFSLTCHYKTHYLLDARCIAMRRLPHYPLNTHCIAVRTLPHHLLDTCCIAMRKFPHCLLDTHCIAV
jgi:hypothetical protein